MLRVVQHQTRIKPADFHVKLQLLHFSYFRNVIDIDELVLLVIAPTLTVVCVKHTRMRRTCLHVGHVLFVRRGHIGLARAAQTPAD